MTAIDVGANFGYYSVLLADLAGPTGRVIAVEPNPEVARALRNTVSVNGFDGTTTVVQSALGEQSSGSVLFYVPDGEPKNARVVDAPEHYAGATVEVPATNIDTLAATLERVDLIKVDAEGAEAGILSGMRDTIRRHRPALLMEINAGRDYDAGALISELVQHYGSVSFVDVDGLSKPLTREDVLAKHVGEDWMVYAR